MIGRLIKSMIGGGQAPRPQAPEQHIAQAQQPLPASPAIAAPVPAAVRGIEVNPTDPGTAEWKMGEGPPVLRPMVDMGYAGVVNSTQGFYLFNLFDQGVGWQLYTYGSYDREQMRMLMQLTAAAPADPVILDIGANIGVTAVLFARAAGPGGQVHAFEAQRTIFHMLAGNMALNSIDNAHCHYQAVGAAAGTARIPRLDYRKPASFGSIELNREQQSDARQQAAEGQFDEVSMNSIDAMQLPRVDLIKIDVEGMEADVLRGAEQTIGRHQPLMYIEYMKSDKVALAHTIAQWGYTLYDAGDNFICVPAGHRGGAAAVSQLKPWTPAGDKPGP